MDRRKVEVLEGELVQLKSSFLEKISEFKNQFSSANEKMDEKFVIVEEMLRKLLEDKPKTMTLEVKGAIDGQGNGGNPNPLRRRENQKVENLEGEDGMPLLELIARETMSSRYEKMGVDFARRGADFKRKGAD
ncbi:hypothetical protein M5K25_026623 [Dendrobium thyrsiflorum]|uniref:Uncharacterized protein n=1 Tax=Dendrobium thyrsiflorum TaxID=117978 RepID=A0ABD0TXT5_DENTH